MLAAMLRSNTLKNTCAFCSIHDTSLPGVARWLWRQWLSGMAFWQLEPKKTGPSCFSSHVAYTFFFSDYLQAKKKEPHPRALPRRLLNRWLCND